MSTGSNDSVLPFDLDKIEHRAFTGRRNIVHRFPGGIDGIPMSDLAQVLHLESVHLYLTGITERPECLPSDCVPIALASRGGARSLRMVLGLSADLSRRVVDLTLGRDGPPKDVASLFDERLVPGEKGALLFSLDAAGGDWIAAGGGRFVVKALLFDGDQIPEYLLTRPMWEVSGQLEGAGLEGKLWLWFAASLPEAAAKPCPIGPRLKLWKTAINIVVGYATVPVSAFSELEIGDRLMLDGWHHPLGSGGEEVPIVCSGSWCRFGRWLDNRRFEVINRGERIRDMVVRNERAEMPVLLEAPAAEESGEISVTVNVEVGSFRVSVQQASQLIPGRIVSLDREVGSAVVLKVQGKLIGRGVLVDHEGTLAVEIKEVVP